MQFELSVALKYLLPRLRHLSVAIIGLVSLLVISLVVWLSLVFLSITQGMERNWIQKLLAMNAPLRIQPTDRFFKTPYHLQDAHLQSCGYQIRSFAEKFDSSLPGASEGIRDLSQELKDALVQSGIPPGQWCSFDTAIAQLRLKQMRSQSWETPETEGFLTQGAYITSFHSLHHLNPLLQPPTSKDLSHALFMMPFQLDRSDESNYQIKHVDWRDFFQSVAITGLQTDGDWTLPASYFKEGTRLYAQRCCDAPDEKWVVNDDQKGEELQARAGRWFLQGRPFAHPLVVKGPLKVEAEILLDSWATAKRASELEFVVKGQIQNQPFSGRTLLQNWKIGSSKLSGSSSKLWATSDKNSITFPPVQDGSHPLLLSKSFRESGTCIGDRGYLCYVAPGMSAMQEMRLAVYVAGFYDPGLMPGKFVIADESVTRLLQSAQQLQSISGSSGLLAWFDTPQQAPLYKERIEKALMQRNLEQLFSIETFEEYDFAKDLVAQLRSDRHLFTLIALFILAVACSNIVSMLLLLVNDKRREIGIMQSLGASKKQIACIFGLCGLLIGLLSCALGTFLAYATMRHLHDLTRFLSRLQGCDLFNEVFYGNVLPHTLSGHALKIVLPATFVISILAALFPAMKAAGIQTAAILRSE